MKNSDLFKHVGFSYTSKNRYKVRLAVDPVRRTKQLSKTDTNIVFYPLPHEMDKLSALRFVRQTFDMTQDQERAVEVAFRRFPGSEQDPK